jgi:hypothetical protein
MIKYRALFSDLLGGAVASDGGVAAPEGVAPDGDLAGQPAETRTGSGTAPASEVSAMDADPAGTRTAGGTTPASEVSAMDADPAGTRTAGGTALASEVPAMNADPAGTDRVAADPAAAGVPDDELRPEPARRRRR